MPRSQDVQAPAATIPVLDDVTRTLRDNAQHLRSRGVTALWVFGSTARGEAGRGSDVDLLADFDPDAPVGLVAVASLRAEISDLLAVRADLVERDNAECDAVQVF